MIPLRPDQVAVLGDVEAIAKGVMEEEARVLFQTSLHQSLKQNAATLDVGL